MNENDGAGEVGGAGGAGGGDPGSEHMPLDQIQKVQWFTDWAEKHNVMAARSASTKRYKDAVTFKVACPWRNEHVGKNELAIVAITKRGIPVFFCDDEICNFRNRKWKDFRKACDPDYVNNQSKKADDKGVKIQLPEKVGDAAATTTSRYPVKLNEDGSLSSTVFNWCYYIDNMFSGKIRYDSFSDTVYAMERMPWDEGNESGMREWKDSDDCQMFALLQSRTGLNNKGYYETAVNIVAHDNSFNYLTGLLDSLPYKGDGFIKTIFPKYLGAETSEYAFQVIRAWMIGAVARAYKPGTKCDIVPVPIGDQGLGKSTLIQMMALDDNLYTDNVGDMGNKDAAQNLRGKWLIELGELSALVKTKAGNEEVKRFLTATSDNYRASYGRRNETHYRQCVFIGTTNNPIFLTDETGNRRYFPINVGVTAPEIHISEVLKDQEKTKEAMELIRSAWAEAVHLYRAGAKPILPKDVAEEALERQKAALVDDGAKGMIIKFLEESRLERVCAIMLWNKALHEDGRPENKESRKINAIMKELGWKSIGLAKFTDYGAQRAFERPLL